jgi:cytochrome-b5 reductase
LGPNGVRQPLPFVDKHEVLHSVALSSTEWVPLVLENRMQLNKFNHLLRFGLADKNQQAGLFCGQYISLRTFIDGKELVRFYSPVSRNSDYGHLDLMIKIEESIVNKPMERFLAKLKPGDTVDFKGPVGGFEYHRNMYREIGLIAGGTGISPMVQIIRSIANHPEDDTHARLLYGNYNEEDILCRDELSYYALTRSNIDVYISLNNPPGKWAMGAGFVNEDVIKKGLPPPANDIIILLCGPPPMIKVMVAILKNLGYTDQMIFSFI